MFQLQAQVKPCIEKLNNDSDFDVRYYASEAAMGEYGALNRYRYLLVIASTWSFTVNCRFLCTLCCGLYSSVKSEGNCAKALRRAFFFYITTNLYVVYSLNTIIRPRIS
jgi:hypothetical protein